VIGPHCADIRGIRSRLDHKTLLEALHTPIHQLVRIKREPRIENKEYAGPQGPRDGTKGQSTGRDGGTSKRSPSWARDGRYAKRFGEQQEDVMVRNAMRRSTSGSLSRMHSFVMERAHKNHFIVRSLPTIIGRDSPNVLDSRLLPAKIAAAHLPT